MKEKIKGLKADRLTCPYCKKPQKLETFEPGFELTCEHCKKDYYVKTFDYTFSVVESGDTIDYRVRVTTMTKRNYSIWWPLTQKNLRA